jgi:hypothetical protein
MTDMVIIEGEVDEDGKLSIQLPPDTPRGRVRVTVETLTERPTAFNEAVPEDVYDPELEALLSDPDLFNGKGLTADEIMNSPAFGIWADRTDMLDSAEYVSEMRRARSERRRNRLGD